MISIPMFALEAEKVYYRINEFDLSTLSLQTTLEKTQNLFETPIKILKTKKQLKNIIVINIESLERGTLGVNNLHYPNALPYLSALWNSGTRMVNASWKELVWSMKSLMFSQCALPLYNSEIMAFANEPFYVNGRQKMFPCGNEFFEAAGYETHTYYQAPFGCEQEFRNLLEVHGHVTYWFDKNADYLYSKVLDSLKNRKDNRPFYKLLLIIDTHPPQFYFAPSCEGKVNTTGMTKYWKSFACTDYLLHEFLEEFSKTKYANNTEIMIMGDHPILGFFDTNDFNGLERQFLYMIPTRENRSIEYEVSPTDIYPTLLDLAGIEDYEPKTPYGISFLKKQPRPEKWFTEPQMADLKYLFTKYRANENVPTA